MSSTVRQDSTNAFRPRLRGDLRFIPVASHPGLEYVVEDLAQHRFFRIGAAEYECLCLLDGRRTVAEAADIAKCFPTANQLAEDQTTALTQWLLDSRLVEGMHTPTASLPVEPSVKDLAKAWNVFYIPIVTFDPVTILANVDEWLGWIFTVPSLIVAGLLGLLASALVLANWHLFSATFTDLLVPQHQLALVLAWVLLKAWHELGHGLVARRLGIEVREAGISLFLFMPIAYVDATSAWKLQSKWERMAISAAGIYTELLAAVAGALGWFLTEPGWLNVVCAHVAILASVNTLLVNANPLLRYDGYYLLADWLEKPNLAEQSSDLLIFLGRRYLCGATVRPSSNLCGASLLVLIYAPLSIGYRAMLTAGTIATAATLFHGAGMVLAVFGAALWWGIPLLDAFRYIAFGEGDDQPNRGYLATLVASAAAITAVVLCVLPAPNGGAMPGVVDRAELAVVRPGAAGFIKQLFVEDGEFVTAGQLICVLNNDSLAQELAAAQRECQALDQKAHSARVAGKLSEWEQTVREGLRAREQTAEKQREVAALEVRSPVAGRIAARRLQDRLATYCAKGQDLCAIVPDSKAVIRAILSQDQFQNLNGSLPIPVSLRDSLGRVYTGRLTRIRPHATLHPLSLSLSAPYGGTMAVRKTPSGEFEWLTPHFEAEVIIDEHAATRSQLRVGSVVSVRVKSNRESMGAFVWERLLTAISR